MPNCGVCVEGKSPDLFLLPTTNHTFRGSGIGDFATRDNNFPQTTSTSTQRNLSDDCPS